MKEEIAGYIRTVLEIDDPETVDLLIGSFLESLQDSLAKIGSLVAARDYAGLKIAAHTLKGCAANVGAEAIRAAALEMEHAALASDAAASERIYGIIRQTGEQLLAE